MYTQKKIDISNAHMGVNNIETKRANYIGDIKYKNLGLSENCAILLTVYKTTLEEIKSLSFEMHEISYEQQAILKNSIAAIEKEILWDVYKDIYEYYKISDFQLISEENSTIFNLKLSNLLNKDTKNIELKIKEFINTPSKNIKFAVPVIKIKSIDSIEALKNIAIMIPFFSRYSEHELEKIISKLICRL